MSPPLLLQRARDAHAQVVSMMDSTRRAAAALNDIELVTTHNVIHERVRRGRGWGRVLKHGCAPVSCAFPHSAPPTYSYSSFSSSCGPASPNPHPGTAAHALWPSRSRPPASPCDRPDHPPRALDDGHRLCPRRARTRCDGGAREEAAPEDGGREEATAAARCSNGAPPAANATTRHRRR
jgi:hypothetical protein